MSRTRKLIVAFWVFIIFMLAWQFYSFDSATKQAAIEHPQQTQFLFLPPSTTPAKSAPGQRHGPDVQQTAFTIENNVPNQGSFTCNVTLKNVGSAKAVGVQIRVRPYRGISSFDEDVGHSKNVVLSDDDPKSQFGDWLGFPDLAPGESSTQSINFISRTDIHPGTNPNPEIDFQPEKSSTAPPPRPSQGGSN